MAINFKDGVILGADSRTTTGAYIANRVTDKLTQVSDTIWCCRSGSAADTQAVADIVHYYLGMYSITNDEPPTTQTAAAIFQDICYGNKDQLRYVHLCLEQATSKIKSSLLTCDCTVRVSLLPATTNETEVRYIQSLSVVLCTSNHMLLAVLDQHISTVSAMPIGRRI